MPCASSCEPTAQNATILALAHGLRSLGADWQRASANIEAVAGHGPYTDDDYRRAIGQVINRSGDKIRLMNSGRNTRVDAIKSVRDALNISLKEAREYVDLAQTGGAAGDFLVLVALNDEMRRRGISERFVMG